MLRQICLAAVAMTADVGAEANTLACGVNADTYAEVVEHRPGQRSRGPVTVVPETLCADLIERRSGRLDSLHVTVGDPTTAQPRPRPRDPR
jgi:hypothetical protein